MKATVEVENRGKLVDGTYRLLWNGPNQWRGETTLPGYQEIQVGGKGMIWVQRNTDFIPPPIYYLYQALGFGSNAGSAGAGPLVRLDFIQKDVVKKRHERKEHGTKLTCFEIENERRHTSETCINESTGTIARDPSFFADDGLQPIAGKVFPRRVAYLQKGKPVASAVIDELTIIDQFPSNTFTPPAGTTAWEGCMNPTPPRLTKRVQPEYPGIARAQRVQGTVKADVLIGTDGSVKIRKVAETPSSDLEASAVHAIEAWRYDPATCNGQPVQDSTILQVNYQLSY
jgi:TonB family protein